MLFHFYSLRHDPNPYTWKILWGSLQTFGPLKLAILYLLKLKLRKMASHWGKTHAYFIELSETTTMVRPLGVPGSVLKQIWKHHYAHSVSLSTYDSMWPVLHLVPSGGSSSGRKSTRAPNSVHKCPVLLPFIWYMETPKGLWLCWSQYSILASLPDFYLWNMVSIHESWHPGSWDSFKVLVQTSKGKYRSPCLHSSSGFSALAAHNSHLGSVWKSKTTHDWSYPGLVKSKYLGEGHQHAI